MIVLMAQAHEPERGKIRSVAPFKRVRRELVSHELVIAHIFVEGINDPLSIMIGIGIKRTFIEIDLVRLVLPIARHSEPKAGHPFAKSRRLQQGFHQVLIGVGPKILNKSFHQLGVRRQASQVEAEPTHPSSPLGGRRRFPPLLLKLRKHKMIDRSSGPARARCVRGRLTLGALKRPKRSGIIPVQFATQPLD